jgi:hypothetical protein
MRPLLITLIVLNVVASTVISVAARIKKGGIGGRYPRWGYLAVVPVPIAIGLIYILGAATD